MQKGDVVIGAVFLLLSLLMFYLTFSFRQPFHAVDPGPAYFVRIVTLFAAAFSFGLIVKGMYTRKAIGANEREPIALSSILLPLAGIAILTLYYLGLTSIGYYVSTTALVVAAMLLLGERSWLRIVVTTAISIAFVYLIFVLVFGVTLP